MKTFKNISISKLLLISSITLFTLNTASSAWLAPATSAPDNGTVAGPLTTSSTTQTRGGKLIFDLTGNTGTAGQNALEINSIGQNWGTILLNKGWLLLWGTSTRASLYANNVDLLGNLSTTGTGYFAGSVGIGTTTPTSKLEVVGNIKATGFVGALTGNVTGTASKATNLVASSTAGYVLTSNGTTTLPSFKAISAMPTGLADQTLRYNSTTAKWEGSSVISNDATDLYTTGNVYTNNNKLFGTKNSAGTYENWMWPRASDNTMYTNYAINGWNIRNNASKSTMFLKDNGNVGINTIDPTNNLSVQGSIGLLRDPSTTAQAGRGPLLTLQSPSSVGLAMTSTDFAFCGTDGAFSSCPAETVSVKDTINPYNTCTVTDANGTDKIDVELWQAAGAGPATYKWRTVNCKSGTSSYSLQSNDGTLEFINSQSPATTTMSLDQSGLLSVKSLKFPDGSTQTKATLPTAGAIDETLRYNGTNWVSNSSVKTNGSNYLNVSGSIGLLKNPDETVAAGPGYALTLESPSSGYTTVPSDFVNCTNASDVNSCPPESGVTADKINQYVCAVGDETLITPKTDTRRQSVFNPDGSLSSYIYQTKTFSCKAGTSSFSIRTNNGILEFLNTFSAPKFILNQTGDITGVNSLTATGGITSGGAIKGASLTTGTGFITGGAIQGNSLNLTGGSIFNVKDIAANGIIGGQSLAVGPAQLGDTQAKSLVSPGAIHADMGLSTGKDINATGIIYAGGNINSGGSINSQGNVSATLDFDGKRNMYLAGNFIGNGNFSLLGDVSVNKTISASDVIWSAKGLSTNGAINIGSAAVNVPATSGIKMCSTDGTVCGTLNFAYDNQGEDTYTNTAPADASSYTLISTGLDAFPSCLVNETSKKYNRGVSTGWGFYPYYYSDCVAKKYLIIKTF